MKRPEDVQLSREEGEALLARLEASTLTAEDRRVLGKVLTFYFWLLFALREAKLSLKRVKALVFGEKPKKPKPPSSCGTPSGGSAGESEAQTRASQGGPASVLPRRRPRRNRLRLGMGGTGPTCIGRRKFSELEEVFPAESAVVTEALKVVYEHDEEACTQQLSAQERLVYYQTYSGPVMETLKTWLEQQRAERAVEPNSSLGKAITYMVGHWKTLTRFLTVPGAPLDNNTAEWVLKLCIRQRKNSLFYATEHSAYIASLLTSLIATCVQAGVNALEYLVAVQEHRQEVFANPGAWLPWTYPAAVVPS